MRIDLVGHGRVPDSIDAFKAKFSFLTSKGVLVPKLRFLFLWVGVVALGSTYAQEVIPDFYREPGLQVSRNFVSQSNNESIDPFTGALQHHYVDLHIPGNGGLDLNVIRSYNSSNVDPANALQPRPTAGWGVDNPLWSNSQGQGGISLRQQERAKRGRQPCYGASRR